MRSQKQMYKCKDCSRQFIGGRRRNKIQVITDYVEGKQTIEQLSIKYGVSCRTIQRDLNEMRYVQKISKYKDVTIQMDTTYWGRNFGLMVIKDALRNKILWRKYVRYETIKDYLEGVEWLKSQGFRIYGAVIDGMRGLAQALGPIPVQMCQFHQIMITRRYLTQDPDIAASIELLKLLKEITRMDKESFIGAFEEWHERNKDILNERVADRRIKRKTPPYMRPKLRSAYLSIKRNMPLSWTFMTTPKQDYPIQTMHWRAFFLILKAKQEFIEASAETIERNYWMNILKDDIRLKYPHCNGGIYHTFCLLRVF